jgi:ribosomal protein S18 acetylase RimI-like enzyme
MNSSKNSAPDQPDPAEDISLREFEFPADYPAARSLWENAGSGINVRRSDEPKEIQKKLLRDPDLFLVAETHGRLIGTIIGGYDGRRGLIYHLAVEAAFRQQGIGGLLMDEVERRLKAKGCIKCYLLVTVDNENAMRFYEKRQWERMDTIYTYSKEL